ncbi:MAG TPA: DUF4860 domain-containing protein [Firmicutes bacterium]|nr:DUF4860 domain-containing protein [Bacillota bacterium]
MNNVNIPVHKGSSVKRAAVMLLLMLFSLASLALALSATKSFKEIEADRRRISELMTALSYLNMKVRQNDCQDSIHVRPSPSGEGQALVITEFLGSQVYETWIYLQDGGLQEAFVLKGDSVTGDTSFLIAQIDGFDVSMELPPGKSPRVRIDIWCDSPKTQREFSLNLTLRASCGLQCFGL